jgi:hypothetical protein
MKTGHKNNQVREIEGNAIDCQSTSNSAIAGDV